MLKKYFFLFCNVVLLVLACSEPKNYIKPVYSSVVESVYASGTIKARNQYQVFANNPGVLSKIFVSEGSEVTSGSLIAVINPINAKLNADNANLSLKYNELKNQNEKLEASLNNIYITQQKWYIDSDLFVKQSNLWSKHIGTELQFKQTKLNAELSKLNYQNALIQKQELQKELEYAAEQAQKNWQLAQQNVTNFEVIAEDQGSVLAVYRKKGEFITAQTPLVLLGNLHQQYIELLVDEKDITKISLGQKMFFTMDSYQDSVFEAIISKIYPYLNDDTRTITIEAQCIQCPSKLYPNLTLEANILIKEKKHCLIVPKTVIIDNNYVVLKTGEKRKVTIGLKDYKQVEILSGLSPQDEIENTY
ncbi:MAG: efflux RND transporter periplasmic adaptor subunit [Sediminibacterium sp.]|nr:efflux RND transporter periplasmic adaptor subunit [Sediminibacterium sp.]